MHDVPQELVQGSVGAIVLALLAEEPRYGYEMIKVVNARSDGALEWREGSLYPALHRMETAGLIKGKWTVTDDNRRRRIYSLTRAGRAEQKRRAAQWQTFSAAVSVLLRGV